MYGRSHKDGLHPHYNPLMFGEDCPSSLPRRGGGGAGAGGGAGGEQGSVQDMVTLAPATVITAKMDTLRDDGLHYVEYLRSQCGVAVVHAELPGSHWSVYAHTEVYREQLNAGVCGV